MLIALQKAKERRRIKMEERGSSARLLKKGGEREKEKWSVVCMVYRIDDVLRICSPQC